MNALSPIPMLVTTDYLTEYWGLEKLATLNGYRKSRVSCIELMPSTIKVQQIFRDPSFPFSLFPIQLTCWVITYISWLEKSRVDSFPTLCTGDVYAIHSVECDFPVTLLQWRCIWRLRGVPRSGRPPSLPFLSSASLRPHLPNVSAAIGVQMVEEDPLAANDLFCLRYRFLFVRHGCRWQSAPRLLGNRLTRWHRQRNGRRSKGHLAKDEKWAGLQTETEPLSSATPGSKTGSPR